MLLPELLNSNNLLLFFTNLSKGKDQRYESIKVEILSRSTSALLHLMKINQLNSECIVEFNLFEVQLNIKDDRLVYSSVSLGYLLNEISPLLSTLRMLQNLLLKFVSGFEGKSLPSSAHDYFKNPKKYSSISADAKKILNTYWLGTGEKLKLYRDIDQHFNSLTERYFMQLIPTKRILIQFPDNPEAKSASKFKYESGTNGIEFLYNAFADLQDTFDALAKAYGAQQGQHKMSVSHSQLGDLIPATDRTLSFSYEKNISIVGDNTQLMISGFGMDQLPDMRLSFRKYYLDDESLKRASEFYRASLSAQA